MGQVTWRRCAAIPSGGCIHCTLKRSFRLCPTAHQLRSDPAESVVYDPRRYHLDEEDNRDGYCNGSTCRDRLRCRAGNRWFHRRTDDGTADSASAPERVPPGRVYWFAGDDSEA